MYVKCFPPHIFFWPLYDNLCDCSIVHTLWQHTLICKLETKLINYFGCYEFLTLVEGWCCTTWIGCHSLSDSVNKVIYMKFTITCGLTTTFVMFSGPAIAVKLLFHIISSIYDYNPNIATCMKPDMWQELVESFVQLQFYVSNSCRLV